MILRPGADATERRMKQGIRVLPGPCLDELTWKRVAASVAVAGGSAGGPHPGRFTGIPYNVRMKIASWNVNSLKVRLPQLTQWLADASPDIVALQETKLEDAKFPAAELAAAGYRSVYSGQKTYNGVAILAREGLGEFAGEIARHPNLVVLGDFNIAPDARDVHDPAAWGEDILCSPPERAALKAITDLGMHDSFRLFESDGCHYSWWDYRQGAFRR